MSLSFIPSTWSSAIQPGTQAIDSKVMLQKTIGSVTLILLEAKLGTCAHKLCISWVYSTSGTIWSLFKVSSIKQLGNVIYSVLCKTVFIYVWLFIITQYAWNISAPLFTCNPSNVVLPFSRSYSRVIIQNWSNVWYISPIKLLALEASAVTENTIRFQCGAWGSTVC